MHIKTTASHRNSRHVILCATLCAVLIVPLPAADVDKDAAPLSAWDAIAERAKAEEAAGKTGYSHTKAALAKRDEAKAYYAQFAGWTPPPPLPVRPGYLRNLAEKPTAPRFPLTGKVWPETIGAASVCLWEDDKVAAASISVDDNNVSDLPNWRKISAEYGGLAITWNLITKNISDKPKVPAGDWATWRQIVAEGFRVESHSVTHVSNPVREDGWPGPEWEAWQSKTTIEQNLPGYQVRLFVYPGSPIKEFGVSSNWKDNLPAYYLAARGFSGSPINPANQIDYFNIRTTANPGQFIDPAPDATNWIKQSSYAQILNPDPANPNYRGWATLFTHYLGKNGEDLANSPNLAYQGLAKTFAFFNDNRRDIWIGTLADIAQYGQERDTATLKTVNAAPGQISLDLTCRMDPAYFDYPLTIKVRIPDDWATCTARQTGQAVPASLLDHEGGRYALVKARPNQGEIILNP